MLTWLNCEVASDCNKKEIVALAVRSEVKPLILAAYYGRNDIVKILLEDKVDINARTKADGYTALMFAVQGEHLAVVKTLIKNKF